MRVNALFHLFNHLFNDFIARQRCEFHASSSAKFSFGQYDGVHKMAVTRSAWKEVDFSAEYEPCALDLQTPVAPWENLEQQKAENRERTFYIMFFLFFVD